MDTLTTPLYSQSEVARILREPQSTIARWMHGYTTTAGHAMPPLIDGVRSGRGYHVPFLSLAEAYVIGSLKDLGLSTRNIRDSVTAVRRRYGMEYALASQRLKTDGAIIMWEEIERDESSPLSEVVHGQGVFREALGDRLRTITYGPAYAERISIPLDDGVLVNVDPHQAFGQPTVAGTGVRVSDVIGRLKAGEPPASIAYDYDLPEHTVQVLQPLAA
jgi:uncharacterized protein (DUF433 family)